MTISNEVICEAVDGRVDFEKILIRKNWINNYIYMECFIPEDMKEVMSRRVVKALKIDKRCYGLHEANLQSIVWIKEGLADY